MKKTDSLNFLLDGWQGYQQSLVNAVKPLTVEQMDFRVTDEMRSVRELVWHIGEGRVTWFSRIQAPGSGELLKEIEARNFKAPAWGDGKEAAGWLERSWSVVDAVFQNWTIQDLAKTYRQEYQGQAYDVSHQWTIFRILAHDIHHGGQLSELLALQGIIPEDLTEQGGHIIQPPLAS